MTEADDLREKLAYYDNIVSHLRDIARRQSISIYGENKVTQAIIRRDHLKRRLEELER